MNIESKEHLSSFMDGEFSEETGRFLVRRLGADDSLRQTWTRYHLIRDCLRHQDGQFAHKGLSHRVSDAISGEVQAGGRIVRSKAWLRPFAGAALAASVALVAILTVSQGRQPDLQSAEPGLAQTTAAQTTVAETFISPNILSTSPQSQPVNLSGTTNPGNQKMNTYLLRHYQASGESGGRGFVAFVPIVVAQSPARTVITPKPDMQSQAEGDSAQR
jgi:sigma-E factor negative regulatory protein RseA